MEKVEGNITVAVQAKFCLTSKSTTFIYSVPYSLTEWLFIESQMHVNQNVHPGP